MDHACPMLVVKGKVPAFVEPVGVAVHGAEKLLVVNVLISLFRYGIYLFFSV